MRSVTLLVGILAVGAQGQIIIVEHPEGKHTIVNSINTNGLAVGTYGEAFPGEDTSYFYDILTEQFSPLHFPGSTDTLAMSINDDALVVGSYSLDKGQSRRGFSWNRGEFMTIEYPGSPSTVLSDVNDTGDMVGLYLEGETIAGFVLQDGDYQPLQVPGAVSTFAEALNDRGLIVGDYVDDMGTSHGFLYDGNVYETYDVPDSLATYVAGVNDAGDIAGTYLDQDGLLQAFVDSQADGFVTIEILGADQATVRDLNDLGWVSGGFDSIAIRKTGFILIPSPSALAVVAIGATACARRRRSMVQSATRAACIAE